MPPTTHPTHEPWSREFCAATTPIIAEPFFACLAEAIATIESAAGTRAIRGPLPPSPHFSVPSDSEPAGLNEIGYKAIPGKPSISITTHEAAASTPRFLNAASPTISPIQNLKSNLSSEALAKEEIQDFNSHPPILAPQPARFRLFRDRAEQAASLLFLLRSSIYYDAARLLFILAFYSAYAPGRTAGALELIRVFNQIAESGTYPGIRPIALCNPPCSSHLSDPDTLALNHAAARAVVHLFAELTASSSCSSS